MVEQIKITNAIGLENFYDYLYLGQIDNLLEFICHLILSI